jgi:hypothetical protein
VRAETPRATTMEISLLADATMPSVAQNCRRFGVTCWFSPVSLGWKNQVPLKCLEDGEGRYL